MSVIIPARDAAATLPATLSALAGQADAPAFEVIVVDDGSTDGTPDLVADGPLPVRLLHAGPGGGPAAARNRGAAAAIGELLAFTDADCVPEPGWVAALHAAAGSAGVVQGMVLPPEGVTVGPFDRHITVVTEYGLYETANLAIARDLFERLGGFESILQPRDGKELGEDVWLGWRARRAGAPVTFCGEAVVRHAVFPRGPLEYAAERARLRFFPELARRVPELRDEFFYRRCFLNRRAAELDLALAGAVTARLLGSPLPVLAAAPYVRTAWRESRWWGRRRQPVVLAGHVLADLVGCAAMAYGSARSRSLLL